MRLIATTAKFEFMMDGDSFLIEWNRDFGKSRWNITVKKFLHDPTTSTDGFKIIRDNLYSHHSPTLNNSKSLVGQLTGIE